ncbi:MAG: CDP-alcohol phosphatidyltransferase family protein [Candidatus Promineifilaceae bacterium]
MIPSQSGQQPATLTDRLRLCSRSLLDPLAGALARAGVSPDALSVLGMLLHALYAWLIASGFWLAAGLLMILFVPLDSLDGAVARHIGRRPGGFGAFLDSTADRVAEILLFAGFIVYFQGQADVGLTLLAYLALAGSLAVSYVRARAEAVGADCRVGLLTRVERYVLIVLTLLLRLPQVGLPLLALGVWITVAQRVRHVWQQTRAQGG